MYIGIIGLGFVGNAIHTSFNQKNIKTIGYDLYREHFNDVNNLVECMNTDIVFLCLPTPYNETSQRYDITSFVDTLAKFASYEYKGLIVIKSTIEPQTVENLENDFKNLKIIHNPEFLSAKTALADFNNQHHIVLGKGKNVTDNDIKILISFYNTHFPEAEISICSSTESESMKIFLNCFYSVKIQFFTELYLLCEQINCNSKKVVELMLKNKWINPMHTQVPGSDGMVSYGGFCFPKDTNALLNYMKRLDTPHKVLESTIIERNEMRDDNINCIKK